MLNLAEKWDLRSLHSNPCRHVGKFLERKRVRYLRPEEAIEVCQRLKYYEARYPAQAALLWLRIYDLRHSFASAALMAGLSLHQIGELLGHSSPEITKRYAHLMEERGVEAATKAANFMDDMMQRGSA
ncbi:MAG: Phage integrase [Rhodospirillaceae bacterium]|nr:MAG: Phage integrase [Rhodospirillaceae bacterium]